MASDSIKRPFVVTPVETAETTVNAGATAWISYTLPSGFNCVGIVGYYIQGTGNSTCQFYSLEPHGYVAVRNNGSSTAKIKLTLYLLLKPQ